MDEGLFPLHGAKEGQRPGLLRASDEAPRVFQNTLNALLCLRHSVDLHSNLLSTCTITSLISCVTLSRSVHLSVPLFSYL